MGCDGGTIPKRHELVKTAKKGEQKDKDMARNAKWTSCTISQQQLTPPIMVCELGRLYSKESMLEYILDRTVTDNCSHIAGMKNVKELKLTPNPGYDKTPESGCHDQYYDHQRAEYVCPVVGLEMNGKYKFCVLWTCGCVLSERALKEVESDACHNCGCTFQQDDVVVINAEDDDLVSMEENMKVRREKTKALRKEKKSKKMKRQIDDAASSSTCGDAGEASTSSKDQSSSTSKKVNEEHEFEVPQKIPKRNNDSSEAPKKLPKKDHHKSDTSKKSSKGDKKREASKKLTNGDNKLSKSSKSSKNISKESEGESSSRLDPKESSVYKKLFTSGADKKSSDTTPHWVTYNPYHL